MTDKLVWNADRDAYQAPYDETHTLFVDGTVFSETVADRARDIVSQKYPDMSYQEVRQFLASATSESDAILDQAHEENLEGYLWAECLDDEDDAVWVEENE